MTVDISKIEPGDRVVIADLEVVKNHGADQSWPVTIRYPCGKADRIRASAIVSRIPRGLEAGDGVRFIGTKTARVVVAVDGEFAWVRTEDSSAHSVTLKTSLERIP